MSSLYHLRQILENCRLSLDSMVALAFGAERHPRGWFHAGMLPVVCWTDCWPSSRPPLYATRLCAQKGRQRRRTHLRPAPLLAPPPRPPRMPRRDPRGRHQGGHIHHCATLRNPLASAGRSGTPGHACRTVRQARRPLRLGAYRRRRNVYAWIRPSFSEYWGPVWLPRSWCRGFPCY